MIEAFSQMCYGLRSHCGPTVTPGCVGPAVLQFMETLVSRPFTALNDATGHFGNQTYWNWSSLQNLLLSDTSSDDDDIENNLSEEKLADMLKLHKYHEQCRQKFYQDKDVRGTVLDSCLHICFLPANGNDFQNLDTLARPTVLVIGQPSQHYNGFHGVHFQLQQYQYYSVGLLSNYDKFYEHQKAIVGPKKKAAKEQKRLEKKLMKGHCYVCCFSVSAIWVHGIFFLRAFFMHVWLFVLQLVWKRWKRKLRWRPRQQR